LRPCLAEKVNTMEQHAELLLAVDSRMECISHVREAVKSLCSLFLLPEQQAYEVQICVVEATSNAIKHAYGNEVGSLVEIKFEISGNSVSIQVCDSGVAMPHGLLEQSNNLQLEPEKIPMFLLPESGWGLTIIKKLMDHIDYTSKDGHNCLTMQKTIPSLQNIPQ
jgi:serine/threonine-protein kinase RsbW